MHKLEISVCLSPALLSHYQVEKSVVVVVDILRATTTIINALANGISTVYPVLNVEDCLKLQAKIPNSITAGERNGKIIAGLDMGNEPLNYVGNKFLGKSLIITTTNGTKLIHQAQKLKAKHIIIGAFINLRATCEDLASLGLPVIIACAGWKDLVNLEDTFYAGALIDYLGARAYSNCDSSLLAQSLFQQYATKAEELLYKSSHYQRLDSYSKAGDLNFCITRDIYNLVAKYDGEKILGNKLT